MKREEWRQFEHALAQRGERGALVAMVREHFGDETADALDIKMQMIERRS